MSNFERYAYRVIWSDQDKEYVALCAEFPSLSFLAETQIAALEGIIQTVEAVVEDMKASGETVPTPISSKEYSGKFQVRIPPEQHRSLALQAAEQGVSINRLVSAKLA